MELRTYLSILWRRKWVIAIAAVVTTIFATVATLLTTPTYESATTVRVATVGSGVADYGGRTDINYTQLLMSTYATILTTGSVRSEIQQELGLNSFPVLSAELVPSTELMRIRSEAETPEAARDIASLAAQILIRKSQELYTGNGQSTREILSQQLEQVEAELEAARQEYDRLLAESPEDTDSISAISQSIDLKERTYNSLLTQYETARVNEALRTNAVSIVEPAFLPREPAHPRHEVNIALGAIVGLVGGVALAFVFENLDTTLYTTRQIEAVTKMSTVGKIPMANEQLKIIRFDNGYQPELEAFRRLRTNILTPDVGNAPKVLMVTSAERGEGKSTIAANLAVSIAQAGRRVLLVDCDMRLPTIHSIFDQPNKRGLTDVLVGDLTVAETMQDSTYQRVQVITTGPIPPNPTELLGSEQMQLLLAELREAYDVVILDTPALLSVTDAAVLVPFVDGVVLVVARTRSRRESVRAVRHQLSTVNAKTVGVVVNRAETNGRYTY